MRSADSAVRSTKAVVAVGREKNVTTIAASLAYYVFNAFVPTVFLLVVGVASFGSVEAISQGLGSVVKVEPARFRQVLRMLGADTTARVRALSLAVAIVVWSSLKSLQSIRDTFAEVYGTRPDTSVRDRLRDVALVFLGVTTGLVAVSFVSVGLSFVVPGVWWSLAGAVIVFCALLVLFFPMYYLFPGVDQSPREVLPGVVFSALAWTVSGVVFRVYVSHSESVQLYGLAGVVLIFLSWLYFGGLAILMGVVLNAVRSGRVDADREWVPNVPDAPAPGEESDAGEDGGDDGEAEL